MKLRDRITLIDEYGIPMDENYHKVFMGYCEECYDRVLFRAKNKYPLCGECKEKMWKRISREKYYANKKTP